MRIIIAGSRSLGSVSLVEEAVREADLEGRITEVVSGCCRGVDRAGEHWAARNEVHVTQFPPDWKGLGYRAGPIRNGHMVSYADGLLAIWDGKSRGTRNIIDQAQKAGLEVHVHYVDKGE